MLGPVTKTCVAAAAIGAIGGGVERIVTQGAVGAIPEEVVFGVAAMLIFLMTITLVVPIIERQSKLVTIYRDRIVARSGVFKRQEMVIPFGSITGTSATRTVTDRLRGTGNLRVHGPSQRSFDFQSIPSITSTRATLHDALEEYYRLH